MPRHFLAAMGLVALQVAGTAADAATPHPIARRLAVPADLQVVEWSRMWGRWHAKQSLYRMCRDNPEACPNPRLAEWQAFLSTLESATSMQQLVAVNRFANRIGYKPDDVGSRDVWATPDESLSGSADCEDYAILKYFSLRKLGYSIDRLRLVVMKTTNTMPAHAILAVEVGASTYYLDNLIPEVGRRFRYDDDALLYALNERESWVYVTPDTIVVTAGRS